MTNITPRFFQSCLQCNQSNYSQNYTCHCTDKPWAKEHRTVDVWYTLTPSEKKRAAMAIRNYDMEHPSGILQYVLTPHPEYRQKINLKIGLTPFIPLQHLGQMYGADLFLKDEGDNPGGSFKDRETAMAALHSLATGQKKAVIYSSGNAAASASLLAAHLGFRLITCVAGNTYPEKVNYIRQRGSDVILIGDSNTTFEEGYRLFAELNDDKTFVKNGFDNWSVRNPYRVIGDKTSAIEIMKQYEKETDVPGAVPEFVVVPTGNGSCLTGIWKGFKELKQLGIINRLPKMVSAAIKNASPVYKAWKEQIINRPAVCDLDLVSESDKQIGSTIVAEEGYDSMEATKALIESGGLAIEVSKKELRKALVDLLNREQDAVLHQHVLPEPASLATLAAIKTMKSREDISGRFSAVAFVSGHGVKAKDLLMKMLNGQPALQNVMNQIIQNRNDTRKPQTAAQQGELIYVSRETGALKNTFRQLTHSIHDKSIFSV